MNTVLYTQDFEPITVIDIPMWLLDEVERQGGARVTIAGASGSTSTGRLSVQESQLVPEDKIITIQLAKIRWWDGTLKPILIADNEQLVLQLKPEWLTGQRAHINFVDHTLQHLKQLLHRALRHGDR